MTPSVQSDLRDRHAVVTGGGRGIGAAIAAELGRQGARLTLMGRDIETLERHAASLRSTLGCEVLTASCDVADAGQVVDAFSRARETYGDPHVLVNNAGQGEGGLFTELTREIWDRMLAVNLTGTFLCTQQVLPAMLAARAGRVVNIASTAGLKGYGRMTAYCASKHGVIGLTRALAQETAKFGVTVNTVCPGYTEDTSLVNKAVENLSGGRGVSHEEALKMITRLNPRGTLIRPEEVAGAVGWLCSAEASGVNGQAIAVSGGEI